MPETREQRNARIADQVRDAALDLLQRGYDGTCVEVPELGETWTIIREATP